MRPWETFYWFTHSLLSSTRSNNESQCGSPIYFPLFLSAYNVLYLARGVLPSALLPTCSILPHLPVSSSFLPFHHHHILSYARYRKLASAIAKQSLVICGDGSYHKSRRVAPYGATLAVEGSPLLSFAGPCPSHCSQLSAIHAELCSPVVLLQILHSTCTTYIVTSGSVQIYNNYSKAVK